MRPPPSPSLMEGVHSFIFPPLLTELGFQELHAVHQFLCQFSLFSLKQFSQSSPYRMFNLGTLLCSLILKSHPVIYLFNRIVTYELFNRTVPLSLSSLSTELFQVLLGFTMLVGDRTWADLLVYSIFSPFPFTLDLHTYINIFSMFMYICIHIIMCIDACKHSYILHVGGFFFGK